MNELIGKEISIVVEGMQSAVGGILIACDDTFLILETRTNNTIRIPFTKVCSILTKTDGGTNGKNLCKR